MPEVVSSIGKAAGLPSGAFGFRQQTLASSRKNHAPGFHPLLIVGLPILTVSDEARTLAYELMSRNGIPATEPRDALHISLAATNGIQYLVTLNFTHIANAETRLMIEQICRDFGCTPPLICSPDELLGG